MVKMTTLFNYINVYIKKKATEEFRDKHYSKIKAFLYMNVSNRRDADTQVYGWCEDFFFEYQKDGRRSLDFIPEFKDLAIGCLGCMKEHYGNLENCNFDETYKILTHNPNASLDRDFEKLNKKYRKDIIIENERNLYRKAEDQEVLAN